MNEPNGATLSATVTFAGGGSAANTGSVVSTLVVCVFSTESTDVVVLGVLFALVTVLEKRAACTRWVNLMNRNKEQRPRRKLPSVTQPGHELDHGVHA
jgi:hypothetical protein